jgi:hypothetical protein
MGILLGFAPFIAFAVLSRFVHPSVSLGAAAAVSAVLILRSNMRGGSIKILEAGTFLLFAGLGAFAVFRSDGLDIPIVRSVVDGGLLLIILFSVAIGRPFTLQYAREQVPEAVQSSPRFIRTNYIITAAWALAMAVIVAADLAMHFMAGVPVRVEVIVMIAALAGAFWFTKWYPAQLSKGVVAR